MVVETASLEDDVEAIYGKPGCIFKPGSASERDPADCATNISPGLNTNSESLPLCPLKTGTRLVSLPGGLAGATRSCP